MDYLTKSQVLDWIKAQEEDALFCDYCLSKLRRTDDGLWYCPNEMCLYDEQGNIDDPGL